MHLQENALFDLRYLGLRSMNLLHHATYTPVKLENGMSNALGVDAIKRKHNI